MYSFYGGKQGRSYKITAHFNSIYEMVVAFQQGGSYTDVNYDEYVIIDTIFRKNQKNNAENGIIYRRGYDFSQEFNPHQIPLFPEEPEYYQPGDEEYDPQHLDKVKTAPTLDPNQLTEEVTLYADEYNVEYTYGDKTSGSISIRRQVPKYKNFGYKIYKDAQDEDHVEFIIHDDPDPFKYEAWNDDWDEFVTHPGGGAEYIGQIVGPQGDSPEVKILDWDEWREHTEDELAPEETRGVVVVSPKPGYDAAAAGQDGYDNQGYHDELQYGYCTIRDAQGNVTGAYIAFDIPYTVFTFDATSVPAYTEKGTYHSDTNTWTYEDLIEEQSDSTGHNYYKHYHIDIPEGIHGHNVEDMTIEKYGEYDEIGQGDFLTYRIRSFDATAEGSVTDHIQLNPYKVIKELDQIIREDTYTASNDTEIVHLPYNFPHRLDMHYTYDEVDEIPFLCVEKMWKQAKTGEGLIRDHVYLQMSNGDRIDCGLLTTIKAVWKQEYNSEVLLKDHIYIRLSTDELIDCGLLKMVTDVSKEEDGNVYAHYNDNTKNLIPVTEVERIAFAGDLFLIRFKNLDMSQYSGPIYEDENHVIWINLGSVVKGNHVYTHFDTVAQLEAAYPNGFGKKADGTEDPTTAGHEGWLVTVGTVDPNTGIPQYSFYGFDYFNTDAQHPYGQWYIVQDIGAEAIKPYYSVLVAPDNGQGLPQHDQASQLQTGGLWFVVVGNN